MSPVRSSIKNFFSGEITVGENSWHHRFYQWWLAHGGGNRWNYRESFCHYMRVVLIWVPLFWFFKAPLFKWVRPWMITAVIATITGLAILYSVWQDAFWTLMGVAGTILAIVAVIVIAMMIAWYIDDHPDNRWVKKARRVGNVLSWVVFIAILVIGSPIVLLALLNDWTQKRYGKILIEWFFTQGTHRVIYPWTVTATVLLALSLIFLGPWVTLLIVAGIVGFLVGIGTIAFLIVGLILLGGKLRERRMRRKFDRPYPPPRKSEPKGTSTLQIFAQALMAKKRKICPFIKLPGYGK